MAAGQLWDELRGRPAPGEAAGSELLTRAEDAAGSGGAGVERGAATGARARGVTPGGHRGLEQGESSPASQMHGSCMAVVESTCPLRGPDACPARDLRGDALPRAERNKTRKQRLSQVFGAEPPPARRAPSCPCSPDPARARPTPYAAAPANAHLRRAARAQK